MTSSLKLQASASWDALDGRVSRSCVSASLLAEASSLWQTSCSASGFLALGCSSNLSTQFTVLLRIRAIQCSRSHWIQKDLSVCVPEVLHRRGCGPVSQVRQGQPSVAACRTMTEDTLDALQRHLHRTTLMQNLGRQQCECTSLCFEMQRMGHKGHVLHLLRYHNPQLHLPRQTEGWHLSCKMWHLFSPYAGRDVKTLSKQQSVQGVRGHTVLCFIRKQAPPNPSSLGSSAISKRPLRAHWGVEGLYHGERHEAASIRGGALLHRMPRRSSCLRVPGSRVLKWVCLHNISSRKQNAGSSEVS